jgi:hypothetical protein
LTTAGAAYEALQAKCFVSLWIDFSF